ncbi:MAG: 2-amino-4-hydroxy-6-hydroxymethyldihydropteridine diphosphokinase [Firmicutes bacterium]|nr:2-amino-4-hydroxy-6-hydroxymethyldihydropteridine diphosphokinase [Bacillota bacterium]
MHSYDEAESVLIGLGSNMGDREFALQRAVCAVHALDSVRTVAVSRVYETAPIGYLDQPDFLNAAIDVRTTLPPLQLLRALLHIETAMGRVRTVRNGPRPIDLDILLWGTRVVSDPILQIPHPRMHERAFVLAPLADIAATALHPVQGRTVLQLWTDLEDREGVRPCTITLHVDCGPIES